MHPNSIRPKLLGRFARIDGNRVCRVLGIDVHPPLSAAAVYASSAAGSGGRDEKPTSTVSPRASAVSSPSGSAAAEAPANLPRVQFAPEGGFRGARAIIHKRRHDTPRLVL